MVSRRVVVTGATGGLGRAVVAQLLAAGYAVRASGRNATVGANLAQRGADFVPLDLSTASDMDLRALVTNADVVMHLAARTDPWAPRAAFLRDNLYSTQRLVQSIVATGCPRLIYTSTPSVYTEPQDRFHLNEQSPVARTWIHPYAETKYAAEQCVRQASSARLTTVILRPKAIVGPHDTTLAPRLMEASASGRLLLPNGGQALVELTHVEDAAAACLAALDHGDHHTFNISGGVPRRVRDVAMQVFTHLHRSVQIVPVPVQIAIAAARAAEALAHLSGRRPSTTVYAVVAAGYTQTFDLHQAHSLLGWHPHSTPESAIALACAAIQVAAPPHRSVRPARTCRAVSHG